MRNIRLVLEYDGTCFARLNDGPIFSSVQAAVDAGSQPTDVIKVAGTCSQLFARPAPPGYDNPPPNGLITQVLYIIRTVTVQGGYSTTNWVTADTEANPTTIDARGAGRALVLVGDQSSIIEGLHLTGGDAAGAGFVRKIAGIGRGRVQTIGALEDIRAIMQ